MLTEKQAIQECQDLWDDIKKSRKSKNGYLTRHPELHDRWECDCPLCEWVEQGKDTERELEKLVVYGRLWCSDKRRVCSLIKQYGKNCKTLGYTENRPPSAKWMKSVRGLEVK